MLHAAANGLDPPETCISREMGSGSPPLQCSRVKVQTLSGTVTSCSNK